MTKGRMNTVAYSRKSGKNGWALFLLILAGIVIGGLIGELATKVSFLRWMGLGYTFGLENPVNLDLKIMTLLFQITFNITISSIVGIAIAIFAFTKI